MSPKQGSQCVRPIVVKEADLLDAFEQGLELFLVAREVALPGKKQIVNVLLTQTTFLHEHDGVAFNGHHELSL